MLRLQNYLIHSTLDMPKRLSLSLNKYPIGFIVQIHDHVLRKLFFFVTYTHSHRCTGSFYYLTNFLYSRLKSQKAFLIVLIYMS